MDNHSNLWLSFLFCFIFIPNVSPALAQTCVTGGQAHSPISDTGQNGLTITGYHITTTSGNCITLNNCRNVTIANCIFGPSLNGVGVSLANCSNVRIVNCRFMDNLGGVYAVNCTGGIQVDSNQFSNVKVDIKDTTGRGQFVQFNTLSGAGNQIIGNLGENILGPNSNPVDLINVFESNGTATDPILVQGNHFRGGGPITTGGGILLGDFGGSYQVAQYNILVNPGQYGMAIPSGSNLSILNNKIFAKELPFNNVGIYVSHIDGTGCGPGLTVDSNLVKYIKKDSTPNPFYNAGDCGAVAVQGNTWGAAIDSSILPSRLLCPILMAHYQFDDNWSDSAFNSPPATPINAAFAGQGENRMCASFNGSSGYMILAHSPWLEPTLEKLTVSCWIKPGTLNGQQGIAQSQDANGYSGGWRMLLLDSTFDAHLVTDSGTVDIYIPGLQPGVWTQLVMTYDGKTLSGYVNGILQASAILPGHVLYNSTSQTPMQLGYCNGTGYFLGYMDELKFYDGCLNSGEVLQDYQTSYPLVINPPPAIRAYYSFNDNWLDNSGSGFTLTPVNGATFVCDGGNSASVYFNGAGDYSSLPQSAPNSPWLDPPSSTVTVSCWIKPLVVTGIQGIAHSMNGDGYSSGWRMLLNNSTFNARVVTNEGAVDIYCSGIQANVWNYVVMTSDGSALNGYVNGVLQSSTPEGGYILYSSNLPMRLGICNGTNYYFNGHMDEFKFFDGPLTAAAIQQDYNTAYPLVTATPVCPPTTSVTSAAVYSNRPELDSTAGTDYLLSPNPANSVVTIRPPVTIPANRNAGDILQIRLYNAVGQLVRSVEGDRIGEIIDVSDLRTGVYYVRIISGGSVATAKLLISR